jgi:hypothetical protein
MPCMQLISKLMSLMGRHELVILDSFEVDF